MPSGEWEPFTFRLLSNRNIEFEKLSPPQYAGEIQARDAQSLNPHPGPIPDPDPNPDPNPNPNPNPNPTLTLTLTLTLALTLTLVAGGVLAAESE